MYHAYQIANYFLSLTDEDAGDVMTNLKLQKLLYYAQGFHLAIYHHPLFSEPIEAWKHGPVVPDIYHRYSEHGAAPIPLPKNFNLFDIDEQTRELLDEVFDVYGQFSGWKLRNMTHEEPPWSNTPQGDVISREALERFFQTRLDQN